jgi:2-aminoethylphosphonate-pyruvate transaminase
MNIKRNILLNPGPATTTDSVKLAQVVPDICPRESEFANIVFEISKTLPTFLAGSINDYETILLAGSGTAAMEAMISSATKGEGLIVNNGAYGERFCEIAKCYQIPTHIFRSNGYSPLDLNSLEKTIQSNPHIKFITLVHHETTTGMMNPLKEIGYLAKKYNLMYLVDAISSFGAIEINAEECNIDFLASTSNKNLQGMAGISFVIAKKSSLEKIKSFPTRNYYLNLYEHYVFFQKNFQLRFTPPVQTFYALKQAILELQSEGVENRFQRYISCWDVLNKGMIDLGFENLVPLELQSKLLTTYLDPTFLKNYNFSSMHDYFYQCGITIYPGKVSAVPSFRIANIGQIYPKDMEIFIEHMKRFIKETN